jgi:hypothetical protein
VDIVCGKRAAGWRDFSEMVPGGKRREKQEVREVEELKDVKEKRK